MSAESIFIGQMNTEHIQELEAALCNRETEITLLTETSVALSNEFNVDKLLQLVADRAQSLLHAETVLIPILNKESTYTYRAGCGKYATEVIGHSLPIDYGLCGWIMKHKCAWWQGVLEDLEEEEKTKWEQKAKSIIFTPLPGKNQFLGGICCMNKIGAEHFTRRDYEFLMLFTNQAAIAIENAILHEELRQLNSGLERCVEERTSELTLINKELESFSYSVSHDLRAPLRSIIGFSHALAEDNQDTLDAQAKDYLNRIILASENMNELIKALLKLAHLTSTKLKIQYINLTTIVNEVIAELRQQNPDRIFNFSCAENISAVGDESLLRIVLFNLLSNALKFTKNTPKALIEFGSQSEANEQIYYVRDNGVGFNMKFADKLFGAFQRFHRPEDFEGTGIGLATVARIINRHHGQVWAEAEESNGATFYFTLGYSEYRYGALSY